MIPQITKIRFDLSFVSFKNKTPKNNIVMEIRNFFVSLVKIKIENTQKIERQDFAKKLPGIGSP